MLRRKVASIIMLFILLIIVPNDAMAQRKVSEEALIFKALRDGVFTIYSDEGKGSGFLIDSSGLIITNEHVIGGSDRIRALLNDSTKVAAKLVMGDKKQDVAFLMVDQSTIRNCPVLKIAGISNEFAFEGEKVIAIGSPLNQEKILTSGIISKVEEGAVISDVNINPGNSGGPLINMDSEVIAINTFGDFTNAGPGISGSISVNSIRGLIDSAITLSENIIPPPPDLLPVMPEKPYPLSALEFYAQVRKWNKKPYLVSKLTPTGGFDITINTPPNIYRDSKLWELRLAESRKAREKKGGVDIKDSFDPFEDLRGWYQFLGKYSPTVLITIYPKIGETAGSSFANILGAFAAGYSGSAYYGHHTYEFKADLKDAALKISGVEVPEIIRGMAFVPMDFYAADFYASYSGADLAKAGQLIFSPDIFAPDDTIWPEITLEVRSIDKPDRPVIINIPRQTMEKIWLDFEPFREQLSADTTRLIVE